MDLERMFDDLFTTYSSLDPPPIKRETDLFQDLNQAEMYHNTYLNDIVETINSPDASQDVFQQEVSDPFKFQTEHPNSKSYNQSQNLSQKEEIVLKGPKAFEEAFEEALKINPSISKYKNYLVKTAKRESNFNSYIQNTTGAPYYGYFQMGKNEIAITTKMSVEQFRRDPVAQILGACKLYEMNLNTIKKLGVYNLGKEKGYSDDALVAGAWMGGPGGVKKYLLGLGDPSDSHWYKKAGMKGGSSVGKIMNNWRANE